MPIKCYAQRMLNPFRGIVNTVAYKSAEAVSVDGIHWDIYVRNDALLGDLESDSPIQTSEIRYGRWSASNGLSRGSINICADFTAMEEIGHTLYQYLSATTLTVPFALTDNIELWLLDKQHQPLALLDSVVSVNDIDPHRSIDWRAGNQCKQQFFSSAMQAIDPSAVSAGQYITDYINALSGETPVAQWFQRAENGNATGIHDQLLPTALQGRQLDAAHFPAFQFRMTGQDPAHRQLLEDFHNWLSPWLLLLTNLNTSTRQDLEKRARHNAIMVEANYQLYPEIIDQAAIDIARVEAHLRNNLSAQSNQDDNDVLPPYYIEINESSGV